MSGYNHYYSCSCRWCLKRTGMTREEPQPAPIPLLRIEQITIPDVKCPVCNQAVFYYRNENGSSVFFDELGPPWPKHPCTDSHMVSGTKGCARLSENRAEPQWRSYGWIAMKYQKSESHDDWIVLRFNLIETGEFRRILSRDKLNCANGSLVYMLEWDDEFCTELEYLDGASSPVRTSGWRFDKWFDDTVTTAVDAYRTKRRQK